MLPRITIIEILDENPKFEIVNKHFSKLGCTPSVESHFIDNKTLENEGSMILFIENTTFFVSYWWSDLTARQSTLNRKKSFTTIICVYSGRYTLMSSAASTFHFRPVFTRGRFERYYPENVKQTPNWIKSTANTSR
jgi:hypothetical protein